MGLELSSEDQNRASVLLLGVRVIAEGQWTALPDSLSSGWQIVPPLGLSCEVRSLVRSGPPSWEVGDNRLLLSLPPEFDDVLPSPLYPAAMFMAERTRQLHGHFLVHASAVAGQSGAVVLMGETGAGKTSAAIALAGRAGRLLISGDRTPVCLIGDRLVTLGHFRPVRVRSSTILSIAQGASDNDIPLPAELVDWARTNRHSWDAKRYVDGPYLGLRTSERPEPITAFVHVRVDDRLEPQVQAIPSADLRRHLHEEWLRPLAGRWVLIDRQGRLRLALRTTEPAIDKQRQFAVAAAGEVPAFRVRGPLRDVVAAMNDWLD